MNIFEEFHGKRRHAEDRLYKAIRECTEEFGGVPLSGIHGIVATSSPEDVERLRHALAENVREYFARSEARRLVDEWVKKCL